jgi:hypothetical protein
MRHDTPRIGPAIAASLLLILLGTGGLAIGSGTPESSAVIGQLAVPFSVRSAVRG